MKKIIHWLADKWLYILPLLPIIIYIISIWNNNYDTHGDTSVPLNPQSNIEKFLYIWELSNRGVSQWRYMYLLWQLPFYFFSLLGFPAYVGIKIYMVSIMVMGFIFSYLFFITFFKNTKYESKKLGIFFSFIFTLCASSIDILPTTIFLTALPLCSYLFVKYLDTGKIRYIIFFSLAINYSYFAHLPQAKYLFVLLGELFFMLLLYMTVRGVNLKKLILKLVNLSILTLLLNAFTLTPFLFEAFKSGGTYSYYTQNVTVYNGDAELNTATLPYITRFFTSSLVNEVSSLGRFLGSPIFAIWTFFLWGIAFLSIFFVKSRKEKSIVYLCILGFVSFMFLAKGPNPPFGEVYKFLLFNVPIFKVFRTTSMSVIGGTLFFAMLVTISMFYLKKKLHNIIFIFLIIHLFIFAPIYFGVRLITFEEKGQINKGFPIPEEYYLMGDKLDNIEDDIKILSLPLDDSYTYKDWSYIGQTIMGWITKKPYIHGQIAGYPGFTDNLVLQRMNVKESCYFTAINNIGYILNEKDSQIANYSLSNFHFSSIPILENSYFKLEKVKPECFLPHIYAATDTILFEGDNNSIPGVSRFIKNKQDVVIGQDIPINKNKDFKMVSNIVIEAYPYETSKLSDNSITKKVSSDLPGKSSLDFWTYSFSIPKDGTYEMVVDNNGEIFKELKSYKKGKNSVKIPILKSSNLVNFDEFVSTTSATPLSQVINKWEGDTIYLISLRYTADSASNIMVTVEEIERYFKGRDPYYDLNATLLSQAIDYPYPGKYEYHAILKTDINAQKATISVKKLLGYVTIDSFEIQKVSVPKVFFTILKDEKKLSPKVVFKKLNPTKYNVDIKNVKNSYHLVLSESFSPDWKVYIKTCTLSCKVFSNWFLKPIPEERHYMVDGFANGWYIDPSDSKMETNYAVVIEYWPQRLLYIGIIISISTLIGLIIYSGIRKHL